jgi:hypothetical protein
MAGGGGEGKNKKKKKKKKNAENDEFPFFVTFIPPYIMSETKKNNDEKCPK